jgi:hypothetical protein
MRATLLTFATLAALLAGCREQEATGAIARKRFVLANADLRSVPDTAAKGDSLRLAALKKHRLTEADLRRFVEVHGRTPEYLAEVWREIADSVQKRYDGSAPSRADPQEVPGAIPGVSGQPVTIPGGPPPGQPQPVVVPGGPPPQGPPQLRPPLVRTPRPPVQPPPPATEAPRPMVRGQLPPPPTRQPPAYAPDTRTPMTRPGQRPLVPPDSAAPRP